MAQVKKRSQEDEIKRRLKARLNYYRELDGMDNETMGLVIHRTSRTVQERMRRPGTFTLDELIRLSIRLKKPLVELFSDDAG